MTNYEIQFKNIVRFTEGFTLNIVDIPITQVFLNTIEHKHVTVTIDPHWKETNFDTIKDNQDSIWLFPIIQRDVIIDNLKANYLLE